MTQRQPKGHGSSVDNTEKKPYGNIFAEDGKSRISDDTGYSRLRTEPAQKTGTGNAAHGDASQGTGQKRSSAQSGSRTEAAKRSSAQSGSRADAAKRSSAQGSSRTEALKKPGSDSSSKNNNASSAGTVSGGRVVSVNSARAYPAKKKQKRKRRNRIIRRAVIILAVLAVIFFAGRYVLNALDIGISDITGMFGGSEQTETEAESNETLAKPAVESTVTIGVAGDTLLHQSVLNSAWNGEEYDFNSIFDEVRSYWSSLDYMIVNLETTFGGTEYGDYSAYPTFNSPDSFADALVNAGVDMVLTANNHMNDTGESGMIRTQEVVTEAGLDYIGTRMDESDSFVTVKEIGGIKFGMVCYTYDTTDLYGSYSLNGISMTETANSLINTFNTSNLDALYESVSADLAEMEEAGCDVTIVFIHWGNEYQEEPDEYQTAIAQEFADMGVDLIIGGHPHVVQKFDVLTGEDGNTTYCLYSMGNIISNQRKEIMDPEETRGYTEDGLTIELTFSKLNNGTVRLDEIYILPTWMDVTDSGDFVIVPLDYELDVSQWDTTNLSEAVDSYNRTLGRLGEVFPSVRLELGNTSVPESLE